MEHIKQRSNDWHAWRAEGIGGSEIAAVLNESNYMTRYQLWALKTGRAKPFEGNPRTDRGNRLEPVARAKFEFEFGIEMPEAAFVHPKFPECRVSLDGYSIPEDAVLEIKCNSVQKHAVALSGKVPAEHIPQVQYQLAVSGAKRVYYYSFDGENGACVVVEPDLEYQAKLIEAARHFWSEHVLKNVAPSLTDRDYLILEDEDSRQLFNKLKVVELQRIQLLERAEKLLERNPRIECMDVQVFRRLQKPTGDVMVRVLK